jgi:tripartite-type tricarboxylate transporter receptor subunit TctC
MLYRRHVLAISAARLALPSAIIPSLAWAQQEKVSRIVVGFPPGGGVDIAARHLAERLRPSYPAGLVVENKAGAAARLAAEHVKGSAPDGSTMLFTPDFVMTIYPHSFRKLAYDPIKDFTPVAVCGKTALAFSVGPSVPDAVKTAADFVAWCRANPKHAAYASPSAGGTPHFAGLMFSKAADVPLLHVPYKGGAPALQDLMGGQIASSFNPVSEVLPQLKSGKLRVLATTGAQRNKFLPEVPTLVEAGFKDVVAEVWLGLLMSANTPAPVVGKVAGVVNEALRSPETREAFSKFGLDPVSSTPESFAALIKADLALWGPVVKASGFTAEE